MSHKRASITVAAAAYPPEATRSLEAWGAKMTDWLGRARDDGAEIALFPEYAAMELAATTEPDAAAQVETALAAVSARMPEAIDILRGLAQRLGLHVVAGSGPVQGNDGRYRNVAHLITPRGRVAAQAKLMLTPWERAWGLAAGERPIVFDTDLGRLAIAICYDSEFPLNVRAQAEAGADVILIPACTDAMTGYSRVRTAALARALENQCATVLSPLSGDAPWCPAIDINVGAACIYGPADRGVSETGVLREGGLDETGWVMQTIDLDAIRATRASGEVRTVAHWAEQVGTRSLAPFVEVIDLR